MTYIASLAKVKVDLHAKDEGHRSNGSAGRVVTGGRMDRKTGGQTDRPTKYIISLASRLITIAHMLISVISLVCDVLPRNQERTTCVLF